MAVRADNTHGYGVVQAEFPSLDDVPCGTGFNRVIDLESDQAWIRGAYPNYPAQWFRTTREHALNR